MSKSPVRRTRRGAAALVAVAATRRSRRVGWVRKNVVMDQDKLDAARRALGVDTETEAIDRALDLVTFRRELAGGIAAVRRRGGVDDVLESRRKA